MSEAMKYKLPPLPKPDTHCFDEDTGKDVWSHSPEQMQAYAIAAIEAQGVPDGWQPIETAPKDVTLLLYGSKRLEMCVGMNHSLGGWVTDTTSEWASMYPPTHWMPLPTAPGASAPPAPQASAVQQEPANVRWRWNIELDGDDLLVCFNDHDKGESCSYQRYVPAQQAKPHPLSDDRDARIAELERELAELRKDAERWRTFLSTRPQATHEVINQAIDDAAMKGTP